MNRLKTAYIGEDFKDGAGGYLGRNYREIPRDKGVMRMVIAASMEIRGEGAR